MSAIAHLEPGTIFATDFRVVGPLSEGGMGTVYVVDQISTGVRRALKLMHPQMVADDTLRRRFEREARISGQIESDHVIHVVGAGVDAASATPWLAMELLTGRDLAAYVEETGPVTPATLLLIFEQLCHALSAAHRMGIVHRDLKPENIYMSKPRSSGAAFTLKVLDFGIAKITAETTASHTAAVGTPMWMAPEQTSPGQAVAPQTDIWALGLIAFWLLIGRSFWRAANVDSPTMAMFLREILVDDIVPASQRAASLERSVALSPEFDRWFARCVQRDPGARYATVSEAHEELVRVFSKDRTGHSTTTGSSASTLVRSKADISSRVSSGSKQIFMTTAPVSRFPSPPDQADPVSSRRRSLRISVGVAAAITAFGIALLLTLRGASKVKPDLAFQSGSAAAIAETTATELARPPMDLGMLSPQTVGGVNAGAAAEPSSSRAPGPAKVVTTPARSAGPESVGDPKQAFAEINKVVRGHLSAIQRQCWAPAFAARLPSSPSNAKVILSLSISPDGTVQAADAKGGDGFSGLAGCVQSQASKLRFAPSSTGTVVSVPFAFASQ